jgi:hypothetical protein
MPVGSTRCFFCPSAHMTFFGPTWSIHDMGCWKGDGPGPPGVRTGVPCHNWVGLPSFIAAMAFLKFLAISTWRSSDTLHTTWLYLHPGHFPKRPKLVQSPLPPTCTSLNQRPPFLMRSMINTFGYCFVKFAMAALHNGGMAAFTIGFGPVMVVAALADLGAAVIDGASGSLLRKAATGHIIIFWMEQSSTKCCTVSSSADCGRLSLISHLSHAAKN